MPKTIDARDWTHEWKPGEVVIAKVYFSTVTRWQVFVGEALHDTFTTKRLAQKAALNLGAA